jgi:CheY-like chemotaxis protein
MVLEGRSGELSAATVLVVDDQADTREMLESFLSLFGMDVIQADCGEQAYARFLEHKPDIILSDLWMPNGNGIELIRRVRAHAPADGGLTPAISVSGGSTVHESLEAGYHYHFTKPVDPLVLLDAIRDFIGENHHQRSTWAVERRGTDVLLRFDGHVTASDMRAAVRAVAALLERANEPLRVVDDLRGLVGFDPSVGAVAQSTIWDARHKIKSVVVIGGSTLARLVSRSCCLVLGIECEFANASPI